MKKFKKEIFDRFKIYLEKHKNGSEGLYQSDAMQFDALDMVCNMLEIAEKYVEFDYEED